MIWHNDSLADIARELGTDLETGLTAQQVAERQQTYGPNKLDEKPPRSLVRRFLDQLQDVMVIILILAALISLGLCIYNAIQGNEAEWIEPIVILIIVLLNAVLGVVQESKAEAALEALKNLSSPGAKVLRDGKLCEVKSTELVPGDVVEFEAGDLVPADCRLLSASQLRCDESALTGESVTVLKDANAVAAEIAPLGDRLNMAYASCAVANGRARALVVETGMHTEVGKIAGLLEGEKETATPLQQRLAQLGKYLGFLALAICAIIFVVGIVSGLDLLEMFMTAVSLAVAAIPEGLPAIVTIVLAIGVQRMVAKNAIIRRLPAVETLGSASVICSDKTGTLTQNRMTLMRLYAGDHTLDAQGELPAGALALLRLATLCTDGEVRMENGKEKAIGDPTETAIVSCALHHGMDKAALLDEHPRLGEIPFDSDRKLMTVIHLIEGRHVVIVKGAPDILIGRCTEGHKEKALAANEAMARDALRVLAIGYKYLDEDPVELIPEEIEQGLTFAGLVGMIDPPRPEAMEAIRVCDGAGIRTIMITGDHVATASAIARQLGILHDDSEAVTGTQLAAMSDEELAANIRQYRVYARVTPADKIRIVKAWQQAGEIVAMTGDGVNDAPALKAADIGCAMGITGTDVAKGAADMTLTDDNFATIVTAVREGRGIYDNIRKAVHFLLSCNLGEILTVFGAMLLWRESPLLPMQLLWINLVTDSLSALALGVEPVESDVMSRPPRKKNESIFAHGLGVQAIWQGMMVGLLALAAYMIGSRFLGAAPDAGFWDTLFMSSAQANVALGETMVFAVLAISQLVHAFNVRSSHSLFRVGFHTNKYMVGAFFISLLLMLAVLVIPVLQGLFGLVGMSAEAWGIVAGLSVAPLVIMEIFKGLRTLFRRGKTAPETTE